MVCSVAKVLGVALVAATPIASVRAALPACAGAAEAKREPAHAAVSGAIGPFRAVAVALTRPAGIDRGAFDVRLQFRGGKCAVLPGPDDPNELFLYDVKSVVLTPLSGTRGNALVVFFNSSQIGPMHGTEKQALIYRLSAGLSGTVRSQRRLLDGVVSVAGVRRRLRARDAHSLPARSGGHQGR